MIVVEHLSKKYSSGKVLDDISISFSPGKVYGIAGENGAGKTTCFNCLSGLEDYEGLIQSPFPVLKDHIGYLMTELYFFPKITGREYLRLFCNARGKKAENLDSKNIFDLPLDQYATTYSTGMKKKLALLAVLLQGNEIFILDEPFNGVDIQSNMLLTEIIFKMKESGKTIILSSHIFSTLTDTCDQISLLQNGKLLSPVFPSGFALLEARMKENIIEKKRKGLDVF